MVIDFAEVAILHKVHAVQGCDGCGDRIGYLVETPIALMRDHF